MHPIQSWRPTIHRLVSHGLISSTSSYGPTSHSPTPEGGSTWMINDIWFLEATHTGASMDLNAGRMGTLHDGMDPARDVLNFIEHVLPSSLETEEEEVLPWKGSDHGSVEGRGKGERKIIGIGHSVGGNAMCVFTDEQTIAYI